jgi:hypothetical protein
MNYKSILKYKPWLKPVNTLNLCERLLEKTKGNVFIVYNTIQHTYELHTIEAYNLSGDSYNTSLDKECVNGFIYYDYRANDYRLYKDEVASDRMRKELAYEKREQSRYNLDDILKVVERTIGTKV